MFGRPEERLCARTIILFEEAPRGSYTPDCMGTDAHDLKYVVLADIPIYILFCIEAPVDPAHTALANLRYRSSGGSLSRSDPHGEVTHPPSLPSSSAHNRLSVHAKPAAREGSHLKS